LDPHLYLSFPSHSRLRSSVKNFTSCIGGYLKCQARVLCSQK
jgi:hypothetical protein